MYERREELNKELSISLTCFPETETQAVKVIESLSRVAAGIGFEGLNVSISITTFDQEDILDD